MENLSNMYYYITSDSFLSTHSKTSLKVIWVGEDAYFAAVDYKSKNGSFEFASEHVILYDRFDEFNEHLFKKNTILNESYPLWNDDYNLEALVKTTNNFLSKELEMKGSKFVIIGNPSELLVQSFVKSICIIENFNLENTPFDFEYYFQKTSFILLNEMQVFKDFDFEIMTTQKLIEQNSPRTHEVIESKNFDWMNYLKNEDTSVTLNNKKIYKSRKN
jgi:hypothetical protein